MILNPLGWYVLLSPIYPNWHTLLSPLYILLSILPPLRFLRPASSIYLPSYISPTWSPPYNTYPLPNTHLLLLNPLHAYTRSYKLISLYKYAPIYPNPSTFVVGPPRGTVEVITRHVLPYTCQYATKQFSKKFIPSINPYIYILPSPRLYITPIYI